ncbi:MAG: hypothetical protein ACHQ4H_08455 [Ktedonobacterales bacterium]
MEYAVREYVLGFRRLAESQRQDPHRAWDVVRPSAPRRPRRGSHAVAAGATIAQLLLVHVYSALALDTATYERFLRRSGVLDEALRLLGDVSLDEPERIETARRGIHSLVMAAEVQHIVERISA